ncbi:hypothetical protein QO001_001778 [Methylobacterium brachiatum]|uniref:Beta-galactosidase GanA n=1 Tax=Methylobacterium brachiatum TaxID=269660 RepID=A0AAJ1WVN2_9HYPH|nr:DUF5597 domain-containing protein [Methylobacterium brachiatum]MCB4804048.1 DUF5597 domain-containing protein [Methylobacterium brachiatum]MDQ0542860.1 hypothetical protein [Methylobacterium brachiatum]
MNAHGLFASGSAAWPATRRRSLFGLLLAAAAVVASPGLQAQTSRLVPNDAGKPALEVDGKPFLTLGIQLNNSSGFPADLKALGPAIARLHANVVMVPVSWQVIEPEEGKFDWSVVDGLLAEARAQKLRLTLLWFGTWKNATMSYTPAWVKRDVRRFPRVISATGAPIEVLTPIATASRDADARAFSALMGHLAEVDGAQRTVIMVQVENEAGTLGADRDHSPAAEALFRGPVPADMPGAKPGTWTERYGVDAPEAFMAYHTAKYIGAVAEAGKRVYALPLYANVWPREQPGLLRPGESSPSGGAVSWLLPQWRALAPAIDVVGVDNYDTNIAPYIAIARAYDIPGNPLFVPETGATMAHARHAFWTLAQPHALGIARFGLSAESGLKDGRPAEEPIAVDYRLLSGIAPFLLPLRDAGQVRVAIEEDGLANVPGTFDEVDFVARFGEVKEVYGGKRGQGNPDLSGRVIVARAAPDRYLVTGASANLLFAPKLGQPGSVELVTVEEGHFEDGRWVRERLLNGDETAFGLVLPPEGRSMMVTLFANR